MSRSCQSTGLVNSAWKAFRRAYAALAGVTKKFATLALANRFKTVHMSDIGAHRHDIVCHSNVCTFISCKKIVDSHCLAKINLNYISCKNSLSSHTGTAHSIIYPQLCYIAVERWTGSIHPIFHWLGSLKQEYPWVSRRWECADLGCSFTFLFTSFDLVWLGLVYDSPDCDSQS